MTEKPNINRFTRYTLEPLGGPEAVTINLGIVEKGAPINVETGLHPVLPLRPKISTTTIVRPPLAPVEWDLVGPAREYASSLWEILNRPHSSEHQATLPSFISSRGELVGMGVLITAVGIIAACSGLPIFPAQPSSPSIIEQSPPTATLYVELTATTFPTAIATPVFGTITPTPKDVKPPFLNGTPIVTHEVVEVLNELERESLLYHTQTIADILNKSGLSPYILNELTQPSQDNLQNPSNARLAAVESFAQNDPGLPQDQSDRDLALVKTVEGNIRFNENNGFTYTFDGLNLDLDDNPDLALLKQTLGSKSQVDIIITTVVDNTETRSQKAIGSVLDLIGPVKKYQIILMPHGKIAQLVSEGKLQDYLGLLFAATQGASSDQLSFGSVTVFGLNPIAYSAPGLITSDNTGQIIPGFSTTFTTNSLGQVVVSAEEIKKEAEVAEEPASESNSS